MSEREKSTITYCFDGIEYVDFDAAVSARLKKLGTASWAHAARQSLRRQNQNGVQE